VESVVTSTMRCFCRASFTISSSFDAMASAIQSAPHCEHTVAGTSSYSTTPNPKSVAKIVLPVFLVPPQSGHLSGSFLITMVPPCFVI